MNSQILTERQLEYLNANRAVSDPSFPTEGYYFIRGIREREDPEGNVYPFASVNWRKTEDDEWEHAIPGNSFYLRLDHLFTKYSLHPDVSLQDLKHQVIHVQSAKAELSLLGGNAVRNVYTNWSITGFKDEMLDALPYFSLFNPLVMAMEDCQLEAEEVHIAALSMDDDIDDLPEDEVIDIDDQDIDDMFDDSDYDSEDFDNASI
ncbi:hypothetical protein [Mucilaginibacter sp. KACC 22063]|uniref:hypothetical protein n=1 Tax=Mucilaginibacter sp. KACC 22063 TaxID=3025666 RepID=UPI002365822D|nr:hypothetical protein [Mucilaginibacter sp. KACC 22063]WDF54901.1 hypothetical protein PQ461_18385 [Mucilaginibacter sp. KACC 22063]